MGVKLFELVECTQTSIKDLKGKRLAADASLFLHQFLSSIRQANGRPLTTSTGKITSHLIGLFSRTAKLLSEGVFICYVFDGVPPALKHAEIARRTAQKELARALLKEKTAEGDVAGMKKYASRSVTLTEELVNDAKRLLTLLGVPVIQAPSEAEAQAAEMTRSGSVWAVASQDADCLVFGSKRMVRNLAIAGRRRRPGALTTHVIAPEVVELDMLLHGLGMTQQQFITMAMLIGTDFNPGGIPGIGPQKARKIVLECEDIEALFARVKWDDYFKIPWRDVFEVFTQIPVEKEVVLQWRTPDWKGIEQMLIGEFEFSEDRVRTTLEGLRASPVKVQKGLGDFI